MIKKINISQYIWAILLISISIIVQVFLLKKFGRYEIILGINVALVATFILSFFTKRLCNILIALYFLPLLILNNSINYSIKIEILFALPIILLAFYTLLIDLLSNKTDKASSNYLTKPILIFLIYYLFSAVLGVFYGNGKIFIFIEVFHFLLFATIILFKFNLSERTDYYFLFKVLLGISILISLEYIYFGAIISGNRFVTFQSGFLPLASGIVFSYMLLTKNNLKKLIAFIFLFVILLAMISTLTRSLWVTTIITLGFTYILFLWVEGRLTFIKKTVIFVLSLLTLLMIVKVVTNVQADASLSKSEKLEERAESIANPTEDHSFLMRIEMGWYAIQKIAEKPILGWGLGDVLRYRVLGDYRLLNNYIDNSWLYFLWKGGLIGFVLVVILFYRAIKIGLVIIKKTNNETVKKLIIGIIAGIVGIIALGFLSPLVIKYRTNIIFPFLFAYLEFEYDKINMLEEEKRI